MSDTIFLSTVTREFGQLRSRLAKLLMRTKAVHVRHQDDFVETGETDSAQTEVWLGLFLRKQVCRYRYRNAQRGPTDLRFEARTVLGATILSNCRWRSCHHRQTSSTLLHETLGKFVERPAERI